MTTTHKYSNGRPVMAGDLCLADLDDSVAGQNSGGRPAAGRVTKLLDDDRIEIAIAPNGYPVIASTSRALSLEDIDAREYREPAAPAPVPDTTGAGQNLTDAKPLSPQGDPLPSLAQPDPAPAPQEDSAPPAAPEPATIIDPAIGAPPAVA
jgi:hypothetical protein